MAKDIILQNGMIALVDEDDFERVSNECIWSVKESCSRNAIKVYNGSSEETTYLSRFILDLKEDKKIFHKDGNKLNFTKSNLLVVDQGSITRKRKGNRNSSSKYKGVSWSKKRNIWIAQIGTNNTTIKLGEFQSEENAALAYNEAAKEIFGELSYQNIINADNSADTIIIEKVKQRSKQNKNGYKGIYEKDGKYQARVWDGKKNIYAGVSKDAEEAARKHDIKAYEIFGDKAVLNFPLEIKNVIVKYSELRK